MNKTERMAIDLIADCAAYNARNKKFYIVKTIAELKAIPKTGEIPVFIENLNKTEFKSDIIELKFRLWFIYNAYATFNFSVLNGLTRCKNDLKNYIKNYFVDEDVAKAAYRLIEEKIAKY